MLYLSIHEGDDPDLTTPVLGSTDPTVIHGVLDILARRLGVHNFVVQPLRRNRRISPLRERDHRKDGES